jgi:uncharacterized protein (DUF885 family)
MTAGSGTQSTGYAEPAKAHKRMAGLMTDTLRQSGYDLRACVAIGVLLLATAPAVLAGPVAAVTAPTNAGTQAMQRLLDSEWEWRLAQFPERATTIGEHRYDDRVTDRSAAAVAARRQHHRERLAAVRAIDRARLQGEDRLSWDILAFDSELEVREDELLLSAAGGRNVPWSASDSPLQVNQMSGPQFGLPQLVRATRFQNVADYRHYLARLAALPQNWRQLQAQLDAGRAAGWMPPKISVQRLPGQFTTLLSADLAQNPLYAPFLKIPQDVPAATREELVHAGERTLHETVIPALQAFRDYLATAWVPAARDTLGASHLPRGTEYYALALQVANTTRMTASEIHAVGLREVARLDGEMRAVMKEAGFEGTLAEFRTFLRTDPRFQFATAAEELVALRDIAKRVDPQLPGLFAELPRLPYGVRPMTPEEGNNAPHYTRGAIDGTRAGYFEANTNNLAAWPRWTMEALFLHEGVPGHHLQIARAQELATLPKVRRDYGNSGYSEGWGLYAEGLGKDLGLYSDPYSRFGRLSLEAHRACRLVLDTGLHTLDWSRDAAIAYLVEHAQLERGFAEAEVDRFLVWPGQATAYKVGELRILELRERARKALGERFDIRRFHNAVLDHGALPLTVLESVIDEWIASERARPIG